MFKVYACLVKVEISKILDFFILLLCEHTYIVYGIQKGVFKY